MSWKNTIQEKPGTTLLPQKSSIWFPQFPDVYGLFLKEEGMAHGGKRDPALTCFLDLLLP